MERDLRDRHFRENTFFFNFRHITIYAYIFKTAARALANVKLNLKLFGFFVLDGPYPTTYFLSIHVYLLFLYIKSVLNIFFFNFLYNL